MRDIMTIIQNAILYVAGNEGIARFNKAGYGSVAKDIVHADGSLDLPRLMNIMLDVFPEEQASAIADNVLAKYVELSDKEKKMPQVKAEEAPEQAESGLSYEDNLAKYLETEASDVQDLINEARMIRMAMGKAAPPKATNGGAVAQAVKPLRQDQEMVPSPPVISIVNPGVPEPIHDLKPPVPEPMRVSISMPEQAVKAPARIDIDAFTANTRPDIPDIAEKPAPARIDIDAFTANTRPSIPVPSTGELGKETLESEIKAFVEARKAYSSVDIMDFIRYLKDKGYHFQENSVLESVYTWVEERKSRERAALLADIQSFLDRMPWPTESEVSAYIDQKKSEGIMCESSEIKRMILVEMIRKH